VTQFDQEETMTRIARSVQSSSFVLAALVITISLSSSAGAATLVRLDDYDMDVLESRGFELVGRTHVEIEAVGARTRWNEDYAAYAWILNSATREVVWTQERAKSDRVDDDRVLRSSKTELDLEPGRYEVYAWAGYDWHDGFKVRFADWDDWKSFSGNGDRRGDRELRRAIRECWVEVRSNVVSSVQTFEPNGEIPGAILRATRLGDETHVASALILDRPMDLRIYSVCEYPRDWDEAADRGWIVNMATRERVWSMRRRQTRAAGGAEKNRVYDEKVRLEAGRYVVYYGTDGSHSFLPAAGETASGARVEPNYTRGEPLLALDHAGDADLLEKPFKLSRETTLQLFALGEWDDGDREFADGASIVKATNNEVVWEMTNRNTMHAGGAEKNRCFDGTVTLPAGEYLAVYETDGSHAYRDWNADPPDEPDAWGLRIYASPGAASKDFVVLDEASAKAGAIESGKLLANLTRVRDRDHVRSKFTLERATKIHILALGEGQHGDMFDFGWIENDRTGDTVWEMTYRSTKHAGGAQKNRKFEGDIMLDAGTYVVHYETDDSHSYADWNDRRPSDARSWGITVTKAE
jgi:hypothetical protein